MLILYYVYIFVILVVSHFGFEGWIWVLFAPVPGHCSLVTFVHLRVPSCEEKYQLEILLSLYIHLENTKTYCIKATQ